jgi:hypothetical protein
LCRFSRADTIRPQSFSLSRRFDPTRTSWLCFAPLPPMGFWPSELFPLGQPRRLSAPVAPLPLGWRALFRASAPVLLRFESSKRHRAESPWRWLVGLRRKIRRHQPHQLGGKPPSRRDERSRHPPERVSRALPRAPLGSVSRPRSRLAQVKPRLRSLAPAERPYPVPMALATSRGRCSPGLSPLRGLPNRPLGRSPPLVRLPPGPSTPLRRGAPRTA